MTHAERSSNVGFATRAIHHGYDPADHADALSMPIHISSTYVFPTAQEGADRFAGRTSGNVYARLGSPTVALLEARMANLEGAEDAVATSSGMGAIAATFWTLLTAGDEIVTDLTLYGCTFAFMQHQLTKFGITVRSVDMTDSDAVAAAIGPKTRLVYFETPANPNMRLVDIAAISKIARAAGAITIVDNTYATPVLQRPILLGANIVVHSASKYLGGHGDLLAGIVVGSRDLISRIRMEGLKDSTGAVLSGFDAFLVLRGLKTLSLRIARHCSSAAIIAERLAAHPAIGDVSYPGLAQFPQHDLARRQFSNGFGGMIAFTVKDVLTPTALLDRLGLVQRAVSLGDAETLIQHPASMTHSTYTPEERAKHGISERLLRLSIGLEDVEDIWADLDQALAV